MFKINASRYKQCGVTTHFSNGQKILRKDKYWKKLSKKKLRKGKYWQKLLRKILRKGKYRQNQLGKACW